MIENGEVRKHVEISMLCKVDWFYKEDSSAITPVSINNYYFTFNTFKF